MKVIKNMYYEANIPFEIQFMEFRVCAYLKLEFRVIFLIGFLFFRRPEPSPMEDLADEISVVVIDTLLVTGFEKVYTFKLLMNNKWRKSLK